VYPTHVADRPDAWQDTISSMDLQDMLEQVRAEIAPSVGEGAVADYIPSLASVDPQQFGMAVASNDGEVQVVGDCDVPFSVQSISKVFRLALVVANDGDQIWRRVSREPSGNPFNSLLQLDQEHGKPRNPFINAGALVVTDRLHSLTGDATAYMRALVRRESGTQTLTGTRMSPDRKVSRDTAMPL
jgi:glutaminase